MTTDKSIIRFLNPVKKDKPKEKSFFLALGWKYHLCLGFLLATILFNVIFIIMLICGE